MAGLVCLGSAESMPSLRLRLWLGFCRVLAESPARVVCLGSAESPPTESGISQHEQAGSYDGGQRLNLFFGLPTPPRMAYTIVENEDDDITSMMHDSPPSLCRVSGFGCGLGSVESLQSLRLGLWAWVPRSLRRVSGAIRIRDLFSRSSRLIRRRATREFVFGLPTPPRMAYTLGQIKYDHICELLSSSLHCASSKPEGAKRHLNSM
jgi:hypothetical protein